MFPSPGNKFQTRHDRTRVAVERRFRQNQKSSLTTNNSCGSLALPQSSFPQLGLPAVARESWQGKVEPGSKAAIPPPAHRSEHRPIFVGHTHPSQFLMWLPTGIHSPVFRHENGFEPAGFWSGLALTFEGILKGGVPIWNPD